MRLPPGKPPLTVKKVCRYSEAQWATIVEAAAALMTTPSEFVRDASLEAATAFYDWRSRQAAK